MELDQDDNNLSLSAAEHEALSGLIRALEVSNFEGKGLKVVSSNTKHFNRLVIPAQKNRQVMTNADNKGIVVFHLINSPTIELMVFKEHPSFPHQRVNKVNNEQLFKYIYQPIKIKVVTGLKHYKKNPGSASRYDFETMIPPVRARKGTFIIFSNMKLEIQHFGTKCHISIGVHDDTLDKLREDIWQKPLKRSRKKTDISQFKSDDVAFEKEPPKMQICVVPQQKTGVVAGTLKRAVQSMKAHIQSMSGVEDGLPSTSDAPKGFIGNLYLQNDFHS